jgi:phenylalanyl-tRNA synthetase beta subunit
MCGIFIRGIYGSINFNFKVKISMKYSYNWLKWYIPEAPEANKLADLVTYHLAEVETIEEKGDDHILDIKILPNRAHDLLSHMGMAREIASLLNIEYKDPGPLYKIPVFSPATLKIVIESDKCRRYMGRIIRNVKVGPSPEWVVKHLESIGQRSINNMVDAANLVMFNVGQPTHVFDLGKVKEKIVVRQAKDGETLITLDNRDCKFKATDLVIADSEKVLGVAGVKGGKSTEVDNNTTDIILEVANFDPTSVRKTAQHLNIFTDAKKRFENDLSPVLTSYAMRELSSLILEMCPDAKFEDIVDIYLARQEDRKLVFRIEKIISMLGVLVTGEQIKEILGRYGIIFTEKEGLFEIEVPPMRLDLVIEEDMAEEIGRIMGYDKVKGELPKISFTPKQNEAYQKILWTRHKLLADGYSEVMTTSFRKSGEVGVLASASDKNFLRINLADGLAESYKLNLANAALLGMKEVKIFEIGTVFKKDREEMRVACTVKGKVTEDTLDVFCKDMPKDSSLSTFNLQLSTGRFAPWSLFPFIARDVAVWVPKEVESDQVYKVIKESMGDLVVKGPDLFDSFTKEDKTSYAFRLVFQSFERTLTDAEINEVMTQITNKIKANEGWQVR